MRPYQLTDDELAVELRAHRTPFHWEDLRDEAARRFKQRRHDRELRRVLESHNLDDLTLLSDELEALNTGYRVEDFLETEFWQDWDESNRSDIPWRNPSRAERMYKAAENGADGSTHAEIIADWAKAADAALREGRIGPIRNALLIANINQTWDWHFHNGSLNYEVG